jgi:hypothetical protein
MSTVTFRHEFNRAFKIKGNKQFVKETLLDGGKGLSFSLLMKDDKNFIKLKVAEISKDKFEVKEKKNDEAEESKEISLTDLKKMVKTNKNLVFVKEYLESDRSKYGGTVQKVKKPIVSEGGAVKRSSKKASKKVSKKASKKGSRRKY